MAPSKNQRSKLKESETCEQDNIEEPLSITVDIPSSPLASSPSEILQQPASTQTPGDERIRRHLNTRAKPRTRSSIDDINAKVDSGLRVNDGESHLHVSSSSSSRIAATTFAMQPTSKLAPQRKLRIKHPHIISTQTSNQLATTISRLQSFQRSNKTYSADLSVIENRLSSLMLRVKEIERSTFGVDWDQVIVYGKLASSESDEAGCDDDKEACMTIEEPERVLTRKDCDILDFARQNIVKAKIVELEEARKKFEREEQKYLTNFAVRIKKRQKVPRALVQEHDQLFKEIQAIYAEVAIWEKELPGPKYNGEEQWARRLSELGIDSGIPLIEDDKEEDKGDDDKRLIVGNEHECAEHGLPTPPKVKPAALKIKLSTKQETPEPKASHMQMMKSKPPMKIFATTATTTSTLPTEHNSLRTSTRKAKPAAKLREDQKISAPTTSKEPSAVAEILPKRTRKPSARKMSMS